MPWMGWVHSKILLQSQGSFILFQILTIASSINWFSVPPTLLNIQCILFCCEVSKICNDLKLWMQGGTYTSSLLKMGMHANLGVLGECQTSQVPEHLDPRILTVTPNNCIWIFCGITTESTCPLIPRGGHHIYFHLLLCTWHINPSLKILLFFLQ